MKEHDNIDDFVDNVLSLLELIMKLKPRQGFHTIPDDMLDDIDFKIEFTNRSNQLSSDIWPRVYGKSIRDSESDKTS
jgi:hypothetical protein